MQDMSKVLQHTVQTSEAVLKGIARLPRLDLPPAEEGAEGSNVDVCFLLLS